MRDALFDRRTTRRPVDKLLAIERTLAAGEPTPAVCTEPNCPTCAPGRSVDDLSDEVVQHLAIPAEGAHCDLVTTVTLAREVVRRRSEDRSDEYELTKLCSICKVAPRSTTADCHHLISVSGNRVAMSRGDYESLLADRFAGRAVVAELRAALGECVSALSILVLEEDGEPIPPRYGSKMADDEVMWDTLQPTLGELRAAQAALALAVRVLSPEESV